MLAWPDSRISTTILFKEKYTLSLPGVQNVLQIYHDKFYGNDKEIKIA